MVAGVTQPTIERLTLPELMIDRAGTRRELSVPPQAVQDRFVAELHSAAERLPPSISRLVRKAVDPFIQQIVDVQVPQMVYGRACLVGDAAFVVRPHAAAGTAKAAADAWALQEELPAAAGDLGGWRAGDPSLRFGLWKPGDSEASLPSRPQGLSRGAP